MFYQIIFKNFLQILYMYKTIYIMYKTTNKLKIYTYIYKQSNVKLFLTYLLF